jgi:hypothetical protein
MVKKKLLVISLLCGVVAVGGLSFIGRTQNVNPHVQPATTAPQQIGELPEHVSYKFLFHHLRVLKEEAEKSERQGRGKSTLLLRFQEEAALTDNQFRKLQEEALNCERRVEELDAKAKTIIEAARAQFPLGIVPLGQEVPPIPPELLALQEERDSTILRSRDRLRAAFGERSFARFHDSVQRRIASQVQTVIPNQ